MAIYMLFDNPTDKQNMIFLNGYETASVQQVYPPWKCNSIKKMLAACWDCIRYSSKDDTIICWYDFMGVLSWWICKFLSVKRQIIAINLLLKDKTTWKNRGAKYLYRKAIQGNNFTATVTAAEYGQWLAELLNLKVKFNLLHDVYHENYKCTDDLKCQNNSVFTGGRNGRDWKLLFEIAKELPEIDFNCVMPGQIYEQYKRILPPNIVARFDINEEDFIKTLAQSYMVVMPLDTEAPAGLTVYFQGAANDKLIITSNTVTTREYFSNGRGVLCDGKDDYVKKIKYYMENTSEANEIATRCKRFLEQECSEKNYSTTLSSIIHKHRGNQNEQK